MATKLHFFTEATTGGFLGKCREVPALQYGPKRNRDTALSGVKRLYKRTLKTAGSHASSVLKQPSTVKEKLNLVAFVLDRSGSMSNLTADSVKALNANLQTLKDESNKTGQKTLVSVIIFDDRIETIRHLGDVNSCQPVKAGEVPDRGNTALFDATGQAIDQLSGFQFDPSKVDIAYVVITVTDGAENSSRKFTANSLRQLITEKQGTDRWTITFLTPPYAADALANRLGVHRGNVAEWEATTKGVQTYAAGTSAGLSSLYASRSVGVNSVATFYTDLSGVTAAQVKKALDDLSGQFRVLSVKAEADIKPFVESETGNPYLPGTAFYQLTKDEKKVQAYKELLIMEKGKKAIYGGPDARGLLGLPVGQDVKVKPGNHANFDIFVQSTSLNRKLVRGTKLLVKN